MSLICLAVGVLGIIWYFKKRKFISELSLCKRVACDLLLIVCFIMFIFGVTVGSGVIGLSVLIFSFFLLGEAVTGQNWGFGDSFYKSLTSFTVVIGIGVIFLLIWIIKKILTKCKKVKTTSAVENVHSRNNNEIKYEEQINRCLGQSKFLSWAVISAIISYLLSMTIIYITYHFDLPEAVNGITLLPLATLPLVSVLIFNSKCSEYPLYFTVTSALEIILIMLISPIAQNCVVVYHNEMSDIYYTLILFGMIAVGVLTMVIGGGIAGIKKIKGVVSTEITLASSESNFENDIEGIETNSRNEEYENNECRIISEKKIGSVSNNKVNDSIFLKIIKEYCVVAVGIIFFCLGGNYCIYGLPLIFVLIPILNSRNSKNINELRILNYCLLIPFLIILIVGYVASRNFDGVVGWIMAFILGFIPMIISMALVEKKKYKKELVEGEKVTMRKSVSLVNIIALLVVLSVFIYFIFSYVYLSRY